MQYDVRTRIGIKSKIFIVFFDENRAVVQPIGMLLIPLYDHADLSVSENIGGFLMFAFNSEVAV